MAWKESEMKLHFWNGWAGLLALVLVLSFSTRSARADYIYTFSGNNFGVSPPAAVQFSLTEASLFTTTETFTTSFTIAGETFTHGYFNASDDCFVFGTSAVSACSSNVTNSFYGEFPGATSVGTFNTAQSGCQSSGSEPCVDPLTLTISETTSATPEPSSLVLLGSGLLGLAGTLRRRLVH
jgi:hypothetical protein